MAVKCSAKSVGALVTVAIVIAPASQAGAKPPSLTRPTAVSAACRQNEARRTACGLVIDFFSSVNTRNYEHACSLLGAALLGQTGGAQCPALLAMDGARRYAIRNARSLPGGTAVIVSVWFPELDHYRELRWLATTGQQAGRLRILTTRRVA
jgi:hypothetical protein